LLTNKTKRSSWKGLLFEVKMNSNSGLIAYYIITKSTLYLPSKEIKDAMNAVKFVKSDSSDEEK
jgi:hypothetical protein